MRTVHLWRRPKPRASRRAAWSVLLACSALLAALTGAVQLAGQAQAAPTHWSVTPTPNRGTGTDQLYSVSCPGPGFCMAAGTYGGDLKTLTAAWNGRAWSIIPSPTPRRAASQAELSGVSCTSSSFCVAVGLYELKRSFTERPLVETWNGKAWSITPNDLQ